MSAAGLVVLHYNVLSIFIKKKTQVKYSTLYDAFSTSGSMQKYTWNIIIRTVSSF